MVEREGLACTLLASRGDALIHTITSSPSPGRLSCLAEVLVNARLGSITKYLVAQPVGPISGGRVQLDLSVPMMLSNK